MQDIDCDKKTIIPCNRWAEQVSCKDRLLDTVPGNSIGSGLWCGHWRFNRARDKILHACDPEFGSE